MNKESFMFSPFNLHQMLVWIRICCCRSEYVTGNLQLWRLLSFYLSFKTSEVISPNTKSEEAGLILLCNAGWHQNLLCFTKVQIYHIFISNFSFSFLENNIYTISSKLTLWSHGCWAEIFYYFIVCLSERKFTQDKLTIMQTETWWWTKQATCCSYCCKV